MELEGSTAVGVNFSHSSKTYSVGVKREVVVSCGALQTPQILELSGIGDPEVLKAAGVVHGERSGREVLYRLVDDHLAHIVVDAVAHAREENHS